MKSNYKKLGKYIRQVDLRNTFNQITYLRGVSSVSKSLIKPKSNIIGTELTKYKIVKPRQITFNPNTARMGDKIPIAINLGKTCIVSQIYPVFECVDTNLLLPEYLMMWFRRPEFDRYARFMSHGSAREVFVWENLCETEIPIPSIEKQREIVVEYNAIQNRIELNNKVIQKLEETAQAIYKHWFVDFEFPNENGKPYKSNGGEMVESELGEIPKGWEVNDLKNIVENFDSKRKPISGSDRINREKLFPYYGAAALMDFIDEYIFDGDYILLGEDGSVVTENGTPVLQYVWGKFWVNNHAHVLKGRNGFNENSLYVLLKNTNITDIITGGVQSKINQTNLNSIRVCKPTKDFMNSYNAKLEPIFKMFKIKFDVNKNLEKLKGLLLSKLATVES